MGLLRNRLDDMRLAMMVLTLCPVGNTPLLPGATLARAVWAYPVPGAAVCGVAGGAFSGAILVGLSISVSVALALIVSVLASGALHEDGLADFCDGLGGGRDREAKLAIMRDSRIGTYGAVALILSFLLRWSALTALGGIEQVGLAWIAAGALSRGILAIPLSLLPPARSDGLGAQAASPPVWSAIGAGIIAIAIALLLLRLRALPLIGTAIVSAFLITALAKKFLHGYTGDVLGASVLVTESLVLAVARAAWL
jgi:adenosylcobinamide-GDP ribazoletransferase